MKSVFEELITPAEEGLFSRHKRESPKSGPATDLSDQELRTIANKIIAELKVICRKNPKLSKGMKPEFNWVDRRRSTFDEIIIDMMADQDQDTCEERCEDMLKLGKMVLNTSVAQSPQYKIKDVNYGDGDEGSLGFELVKP